MSTEPRAMKFVLIRPQMIMPIHVITVQTSPSIGLAYLAASVREAGHKVSVIDAVGEGLENSNSVEGVPNIRCLGLPILDILERIPVDVDVIGIGCTFSMEWVNTRELMKQIRARFPFVKIVAGGEHISACIDYVFEDCKALDLDIIGEGEETLVDLLNTLSTGGDLSTVKGLVYQLDGKVCKNPRRARVRDVDSFPEPAWDLFPLRNYIDAGDMIGVNMGRSMPMLASRGCPYECAFCSNPNMWGRLWKARDPELLLAEMKRWIKEYNVTNFDFYDLTAILKKDWIITMANLIIESGLKITWQLPVGTRSEVLDEDVVGLLYESGCRHLTYAPESGSEYMLKQIKKKINKKAMLHSIRVAYKAGIKTKAHLLVAFPDESFKHVMQSYGFAIRLAFVGLHDLAFSPFSPYPGSELSEKLLKEGKIAYSDNYFYSLVENRESFSQHLPTWSLKPLCTGGMILFYGMSFLLRPVRILSLIKAVWSNQAQTKLDAALIRRKKHQRRLLGPPKK